MLFSGTNQLYRSLGIISTLWQSHYYKPNLLNLPSPGLAIPGHPRSTLAHHFMISCQIISFKVVKFSCPFKLNIFLKREKEPFKRLFKHPVRGFCDVTFCLACMLSRFGNKTIFVVESFFSSKFCFACCSSI